eukprot:s200_g5.t1
MTISKFLCKFAVDVNEKTPRVIQPVLGQDASSLHSVQSSHVRGGQCNRVTFHWLGILVLWTFPSSTMPRTATTLWQLTLAEACESRTIQPGLLCNCKIHGDSTPHPK